MRIDARDPGFRPGWWVYHAEECREVPHVVWVDDETNEYGTYRNDLSTVAHKVRKIAIHADRRLIIINPVEDSDQSDTVDVVSQPVVAA